MKKIFLGLLIFASVALAAGHLADVDVKTQAEVGGVGSRLANDVKFWLTGLGLNETLFTAITNGDLSGGGGASVSGGYMGNVIYPEAAGCVWTQFGVVTTWGSFAAAPSCPMPTGAAILGNNVIVSDNHAGKLPTITLVNVDPTKVYKIIVTGVFVDAYISNYAHTIWRLYDQKDAIGSAPILNGFTGGINNGVENVGVYETYLKFSTSGTHTVEMQCSSLSNAGGACLVVNNAPGASGYSELTISAYQYDILP